MSGQLTTGKLVLTNTTSNQDAFDRLRVSQPNTLIELNHTIGKMPFMIDEIITGAGSTSVNITSESYIKMGVNTGVTGSVIRQSYEYFPYQPGKSKLMLFSGVLGAIEGGVTGVVSRVGSYDSSINKTFAGASGTGNGLFFELGGSNGKVLYAVVRLNNNDTAKVAMSSWNHDTFDGNGPSGLIITDFSTAKIFTIDQEWLGVGTVRFGFFINGTFHLGHVFNHSGIGLPSSTAIIAPYTKTAKLPVRCEILSSITPGHTYNAEMRMICSTVLSEGGFEPAGLNFSIGRDTAVTVSTALKPIISLKLRETEPYNRKTLVLKGLTLLNTTTRGMQWDLYLLHNDSGLTSGKSFQNVDATNSCAMYDLGSTVITLTSADVLVDSGYADLAGTVSFNYDSYLSSPVVNSSISGQSRVLALCGKRLTNQDVTNRASLSWIEIM
jgi:hypothetical protein